MESERTEPSRMAADARSTATGHALALHGAGAGRSQIWAHAAQHSSLHWSATALVTRARRSPRQEQRLSDKASSPSQLPAPFALAVRSPDAVEGRRGARALTDSQETHPCDGGRRVRPKDKRPLYGAAMCCILYRARTGRRTHTQDARSGPPARSPLRLRVRREQHTRNSTRIPF